MADFVDECVRSAVCRLNSLKYSTRELTLKQEQEIAVKELLVGKHVLAVLPTGFGKSLIYTLFLMAREEMSGTHIEPNGSDWNTVLVISPLRSIIMDQMEQMKSLGFSVVELSSENVSQVIASPPQFVYTSAESAVEQQFLDGIKNSSSCIHQAINCIVVDESHTVETWTGER